MKSTCANCGKPIKWYDGWQLWATIPEGGKEDTIDDLICEKGSKRKWGIVGGALDTPGHESKEERVKELLLKIEGSDHTS